MMAEAELARTAGDNHLPPDIWTKLLAGLPAKSILRCRSVCKSWYSLVSSPSFISYYSSKTLDKNRDRVLLQLVNTRFDKLSFSSLNESFMESRKHDDFRELHDQVFEIVGSCNGLICLFQKSKHRFPGITFFIWNPTIRKVVRLPTRNHRKRASYVGFGFDSKTSDYKVMYVVGKACAIFDLRRGVWRSISHLKHQWKVGPPRVEPILPECYLDGAVHWSRKKQPEGSDMILLSFDMSDECFRDVKMPDFTKSQTVTTPQARDIFTTVRSMTLGGLIYVFACNTIINCSTWVMKEYGVAESWTKVSNMDMHRSHISTYASLVWKNGEVLMAEESSGYGFKQNLVLYNMERKRSKRVFSNPEFVFVRDMCLYEDSLVLM